MTEGPTNCQVGCAADGVAPRRATALRAAVCESAVAALMIPSANRFAGLAVLRPRAALAALAAAGFAREAFLDSTCAGSAVLGMPNLAAISSLSAGSRSAWKANNRCSALPPGPTLNFFRLRAVLLPAWSSLRIIGSPLL